MKRLTAVIMAVAFLGAFQLADAGVPVKSSDPIELLYWSHQGQMPAFVHAFGEIGTKLLRANGYPNATVRSEVIEYETFEQKYLSAFAAGRGPDIFVATAAVWAMDGGLHPIAIELPDDVAKLWDPKLHPVFRSMGTFKGKRYGFSVEGSGQLLFINTDHFKEAGLDPNKPPRNVEEFIEAAKKLTKTDASGKITRSGYHPRYLGQGLGVASKFLMFLHIFGGRMLSEDMTKASGYINSPQSVAAFQFYHDLVYKHKVVNLDFGTPERAFQQGMTSMIVREGWFAADTIQRAPNIKFKVVPFIVGPKSCWIGNNQPWANMISKNSKHKDVAFDLFRLLATVEADVALHKVAGYTPVLTETLQPSNEYFRSLPFGEALVEDLKKPTCPEYIIPKFESYFYILGEEISACLKGTPAKAAADRAAKRIEEALSAF